MKTALALVLSFSALATPAVTLADPTAAPIISRSAQRAVVKARLAKEFPGVAYERVRFTRTAFTRETPQFLAVRKNGLNFASGMVMARKEPAATATAAERSRFPRGADRVRFVVENAKIRQPGDVSIFDE